MTTYEVSGSYRGEEIPTKTTKSAAEAFSFYRDAENLGWLPVTSLRVTADGVEITVEELELRMKDRNA